MMLLDSSDDSANLVSSPGQRTGAACDRHCAPQTWGISQDRWLAQVVLGDLWGNGALAVQGSNAFIERHSENLITSAKNKRI